MTPSFAFLVGSLFLAGTSCTGTFLMDTEQEPPPTLEDSEEFDPSIGNVVDGWIMPRLLRLGVEPHYANQHELIRRMSLDLNGVVPDASDFSTLADASAEEIANHYMDRPGFIGVSQVIFSDLLAYSNDTMYSTQSQVVALNDLVGQLHAPGPLAWDDFAKRVITSDAFLSRFTSSVDRATATYVIFLGYAPITPYDFRLANLWNGYSLTDEENRVFEWTGTCDSEETDDVIEVCEADIWGMHGSNATDAGNMLASLPVFAEHGATMVWKRYIGSEISPELPELTVELGRFFAESGFDIRALTREIVTSLAYRQSFNYRDEDLVW